MIGIPETLIIIITFIIAVIALLWQKGVTKAFKVSMILLLLCLAFFQYIQIYNSQNENSSLSDKLDKSEKQVKKLTDEITKLHDAVAQSERRPVIDIEREQLPNIERIYIVNKGLEPAYNVQVSPLTDKLNQKNISILGNESGKREFIGTLSSNEISPLTQIRVRVYFLDSSSNRYKWEFLINKFEVISILRQHYKKLPNGENDYEHPVVEYKSGKYY